MSNLLNFLYSKIKPYSAYIIITIMTLIFIVIFLVFYNNVYLKNYVKKTEFKDVANLQEKQEDINLYYVSAKWCPYCKKADGPWSDFVNKYDKKVVNNRVVNCINIKDDDPNFEEFNKIYKIEKYPTVFIIYNNQKYDFDSSVTVESLKEFVNFVAYK